MKYLIKENLDTISESDIRDTWNQIAIYFDKRRSERWEKCIDYINLIPANSCVIDLGCGNGRHLIPLAEKANRAYGLDISEKMLETARKNNRAKCTNISLIQGSVATLPFHDNSFDAGLFIATLHHVPTNQKRIQALSEIKRVLKPEGTLLISVWARYQERFVLHFIYDFISRLLFHRAGEYGDILVEWKHEEKVSRFYHLFTLNEIKQLILEAGLKIIEIKHVKIKSTIVPDNYFVLVKKDKN